MMKCLFLTIAMIGISFVLYADIFPGTRKLLFPDSLNGTLNRLMLDELQKRIPKDRVYHISETPIMAPWHRLTDSTKCTIALPNTKIQDPKEALELFFPYARAYVDTMNNVREVRPYFVDFPFSFYMWAFSVEFARDPKTNLYFYDPYITSVYVYGPKIIMSRLYKEKKMADGRLCSNVYSNIYGNSSILPETIQKMAIPQFDVKKVPTLIPEAKKSSCFNSGDETLFRVHKEWAKKNNFLMIGTGSVMGFERPWGTKIQIEGAYAAQEKQITLEEAKALVLQLRDDHLSFYIEDGWLKNFVNFARKDGKEPNETKINAQEYMAFKVSFWDKYIDRIMPPYIAEIRVIGTKAKYYVSDELQRLQLLYEEDLPRFEVEIPVIEGLIVKKKSIEEQAEDDAYEAEALKKLEKEGWPS